MLVYTHDSKHVITIAQIPMHLSVKEALKTVLHDATPTPKKNQNLENVQILAVRCFPSGPRYSLQNPG